VVDECAPWLFPKAEVAHTLGIMGVMQVICRSRDSPSASQHSWWCAAT